MSSYVRRSAGFAIWMVLVVVTVLTFVVIAYQTIARNQSRITHRFLIAETAHQLALAGVQAAVSALTAAGPDGDPRLSPLLTGTAETAGNLSFGLSSTDSNGALPRLVQVYTAGDGAKVAVTVTFREVRSLWPAGFKSAGGTHADPMEKAGVARILSTGTYLGQDRVVESFRKFKVIRPLPSVVGRFTLLAKNCPPGRDGVNLMEIAKRQAFPAPKGQLLSTSDHDALVLTNSSRPYAPGQIKTFTLDNAGWVFLGNELFADSRWVMNLTYGGDPEDPFGEQFLLIPRSVFLGADPLLNKSLTAEGRELLATRMDRLALKCGFYGAVAQDTLPVFKEVAFERQPMGASSLHLFGSTAKPSPTLVLGRAFRRFLQLSFLTDKSHAKSLVLPFARVEQMSGMSSLMGLIPFRPEPGGTPPLDPATIFTKLCDDRPALYGRLMSQVLVEPYMRALDFMEKNLDGTPGPDAFDPPFEIGDLGTVSRIVSPLVESQRSGFLYRPDASSRVVLKVPDGRRLFAGDLNGFEVGDLLLLEKATYVFKRSDLGRWLSDGKLTVRGVMVQDPREPEMVIDRPIEVQEGGVLVCRGNILISSPVTSAPTARFPLTLVSLEGKIVLKTDRVDAHLIALGPKGAVERLDRGPLEIKGAIATTVLDLDSLARGSIVGTRPTKTLTWDERADPVKAGADSMRVFVDTARLTAVH